MDDRQGGGNSGLFRALKNIAVTLLASGKTRLELLGNEIEAGKLRAIRLLLLAQGMAFCFAFCMLLAVAWMTVLFWDSRVIVLGASTGFSLFSALCSLRCSSNRHGSPSMSLPSALPS